MGQQPPQLLYAADVPVESTLHGSALVYRLLDDYDPARLLIVETGGHVSAGEKRLHGVRCAALPVGQSRWLQTRFNRLANYLLTLRARRFAIPLQRTADGFAFEAILSIAHGFGWITAARLAKKMNLPLHLIVHDDWPRVDTFPKWASGAIDRIFCDIYRQAASRLCVSPYMEEDYARRYGVRGSVLYPSRARDCAQHTAPPERLARTGQKITAAYAGSINSPSYAGAIAAAARTLASLGGELLLFGPFGPEQLQSLGLDLPNIFPCGMVPSAELITRFRNDADFVFVPMSFEPHELPNMERSFPSKLTDYTAAGVPLLIWGPPTCSAIRWARDNPGVAETVESADPALLDESIARLASDPRHRLMLGKAALETGGNYFGHHVARDVLFSALTSPSS